VECGEETVHVPLIAFPGVQVCCENGLVLEWESREAEHEQGQVWNRTERGQGQEWNETEHGQGLV
jgi:hypothetical protein